MLASSSPPSFRETHDCLQLDPQGQASIHGALFRHPWLTNSRKEGGEDEATAGDGPKCQNT